MSKPTNKHCLDCNILKTKENTYLRKTYLVSYCKKCVSKRQWKYITKEQRCVQVKHYQKKNVSKWKYQSLKSKCKFHKIKFNLTESYIEKLIQKTKFCPILGLKLEVKSKNNNSLSIDRIIPEKGYTIGNVQVVCMLANKMKTDSNKDQLIKFANWIYKTYKQN